MNNILRCYILLVALIFNPFFSSAAVFPDKPGKQDFFADEANVIAAPERKIINDIAGKILKEEQIPLFVVTIPSLADKQAAEYTIEKYAYELFNKWGIGSPKRNLGMLLLVSVGDRRARIELGTDWGFSYNQSAKEVIDTLIVPQFRKKNYSQGILAGAQGMDALARGLAIPKPKSPWWIGPLLIGLFALIIFIIFNLFKSGRSGWGWALIAGLGMLIFFMLRATASGSGGGFGGGSSGGGGASGSW